MHFHIMDCLGLPSNPNSHATLEWLCQMLFLLLSAAWPHIRLECHIWASKTNLLLGGCVELGFCAREHVARQENLLLGGYVCIDFSLVAMMNIFALLKVQDVDFLYYLQRNLMG